MAPNSLCGIFLLGELGNNIVLHYIKECFIAQHEDDEF